TNTILWKSISGNLDPFFVVSIFFIYGSLIISEFRANLTILPGKHRRRGDIFREDMQRCRSL
ncbi:hypothetical protein, partial [Paramuribaculum intestinale]|uniref:hypothetical protein n=1 Tax=Paramuribaculum intestinale TaxID=2094151 RepID=UPI00272A6B6E